MAGCASLTQTTSGKDYLNRHGIVSGAPKVEGELTSIEEQIREAAAVEPNLRFPARIGLARIEDEDFSSIPPAEADAWIELAQTLGPEFGEFVLVSPLVMELVTESVASKIKSHGSELYRTSVDGIINKIRLAAARQHLDAVLIYEVYGKADEKKNALSVANLTLVGNYLLPTRTLEADGFASALLIDVLQGYPYGTAYTTIDGEKKHTTNWGSKGHQNERLMAADTASKAGVKLAGEVQSMLKSLRVELAQK